MRGNCFPLAVTTSGKSEPDTAARAKAAAREWGLPFIERPRKTALKLLLDRRADAFLVFTAFDVVLCDSIGSLRFNPGIAKLRIKRLEAGVDEDLLVRFAEFKEGDRVLDGTLGLAADSLVAAHCVGPTGRVVALEKSLPLFAVMSQGLAGYRGSSRSSAIEVHHTDAADYLRQQPHGSFDCVLLDPMFPSGTRSSPSFDALRRFADYSELTSDIVGQASRVARRMVVVKASRRSRDLARLGLSPASGTRYSAVAWARIPGIGI